ncbi:pilus assembly FimT family protein [Spiribacter insolitus]|uniref:Prepilin-type N-terminal cleavage/methylation domain-containing protein n=1 Tax=Spiribacter insolitus TaxID=3122417 RepID=A0ABV3T781_9GAMM
MRPQGGFTLMEIVITIAVLGILAGVAFNVSGIGGNRISEVLRAEDRVKTELRRARAEALYRLPEMDGNSEQPFIALIDAFASDASVCPEEVPFLHPIGEVDANSVSCSGCAGCLSGNNIKIKISIDSTERCLQLISANGKINEIDC